MSFLKKSTVRFCIVFLCALAMTIGGATIGAFADSGGATATVHAGQLTEAGTFGESVSTTLDGTDQTLSYTLPVQLKDATGSGSGWNLQISATALSDGVNGHSALTQQVSAASASCVSGNHCTGATSATPPSYPLVLSSTAQKFFSADANSGMGILNVSTSLQVLVPGNTYAGTYTTTLTLAVVSGP
ncbi:MAG TPA: WxL domain-containing protein [Ktedonobacteraceae bacterium]|nr:WxL domain-containing protein [Ktedonobacteraceae bacterium]